MKVPRFLLKLPRLGQLFSRALFLSAAVPAAAGMSWLMAGPACGAENSAQAPAVTVPHAAAASASAPSPVGVVPSSPDSATTTTATTTAAAAAAVGALVLDYTTPTNPALQSWLEKLDDSLRTEFAMTERDTAAGVLDLRTGRLAMVRPDQEDYAASVAKIGILFAWFDIHRDAPGRMDPQTALELGEMAKVSSNEMAAKFSREIGLQRIQSLLTGAGFYDASHGGGLWVGRHYGQSDERYGDPVADHSHAATVRQVLRFFLLMEQGRLVSPEASAEMRRIFDTPSLPHDNIKFVKALSAIPDLRIRRKWGTWQDWRHDAAAVSGPGRNYLLAALTHHPRGDEYLEKFAAAVDAHLTSPDSPPPAAPAPPAPAPAAPASGNASASGGE